MGAGSRGNGRIMSKLLINEPPLEIQPSLARIIGLNEAIVLQQLHYWMNKPGVGKEHKGRRWVYNSIPQWQQTNFPFWSEGTIKRTFASLKKQKLVSAKNLNRKKYDRTLWYTINYDRLDELERGDPIIGSNCTDGKGQNVPINRVKMDRPIPETTTETNTETTFSENAHHPTVEHIPAKHDPAANQPNRRILYPAAHLATQEMTAAWQEWVTHRAEIGKPISVSSYNLQMKWIEEHGQERAIAAIENSILHSYTGLVEPKQNRSKSHGTNNGYSRTTVTKQPPVNEEFLEYVRQATASK
jgi:hypothetical protein